MHILLSIIILLLNLSLFTMDLPNDLWVKIIACSKTSAKNALGKCCTALHTLYSKNNIDIYMQDPLVLSQLQGEYALMLCAYKNNIVAVNNLLSHGAHSYYSYCGIATSPLAMAGHHNNLEMIDLLRSRCEFNDSGKPMRAPMSPHSLAAFFGDMQTLRTYVNSAEYNPCYFDKKHPCYPSATLLKLAIFRGHHDAVDLLLTHPKTIRSINSGKKGDRPIDLAFYKGDSISVQKLFAIPSVRFGRTHYYSQLYKCARCGWTDCLQALLKRYNNRTPNKSVQSSLINVFGDTDIRCLSIFFCDVAPLTIAAYCGKKDCVALFLKHKKINVNIPVYCRTDHMYYFLTPLYAASLNGHADIVEQLLSHYDINPFLYMEKYTPLHVACKRGHVDIARMLIKRCPALLYIKTTDTDESPYQLAYHYNQYDVVELLLEFLS